MSRRQFLEFFNRLRGDTALIVKAVIDAFRPGSFVGSHNEWTLIGLRINSVFDVDIDDGEVERGGTRLVWT